MDAACAISGAGCPLGACGASECAFCWFQRGVPRRGASDAAKVDAIFAKHKSNVRVELKNKARGEFALFFEPLAVKPATKGPQGWNLDQFVTAIQSPAPNGLGLTFEVKGEN